MPTWADTPPWKMVWSLSEISQALRAATSKGRQDQALLVLEDGTAFWGWSCGAPGEVSGEVCFNTSLVGYLEVLTDPSYAGQIICMTYPQIGNYGVSEDDAQRSCIHARGLIVRDMCTTPSSWRSDLSLPAFLKREGVVCIEGVDTRALVRHIREHGAMTGVLSTTDLDAASLARKAAEAPALVGENLVKGVSDAASTRSEAPASHAFAQAAPKPFAKRVVAYDCGAKDAILENLTRAGCQVMSVDWDTPADEVLALHPDGVFLSNGPGDPDAVTATFQEAQRLVGKVPLFGICLGHQMLGLAAGAQTEKLKYGHRGGNHPVQNLLTGRVEITSQNHGFGLLFKSLGPLIPEESGGFEEHVEDLRTWAARGVAPVVRNDRFGRIRLTHVNLNDGTLEGIQCLDVPAFSVQYHPEASPGPTDAHYLFTAFMRLMEGDADYLDIDIARDRLAGWRFGGEARA